MTDPAEPMATHLGNTWYLWMKIWKISISPQKVDLPIYYIGKVTNKKTTVDLPIYVDLIQRIQNQMTWV